MTNANELKVKMTNTNDFKDWKVRGPMQRDPERADQANACRVLLSPESLKYMRLRSNQVCLLWKAEEPDVKYEAIAWMVPTAHKINDDVALFYDTNRTRCGFELTDRICISASGLEADELPTGKSAPTATSVEVREVSHELPNPPEAITQKYKSFWECYLEQFCLKRAEYIFPGMTLLENLQGEKRRFRIESINGNRSSTRIARFDPKSNPVVSILSGSEQPMHSGTMRPRLEVAGIAGIDSALKELNKHLQDFEEQRPSEYPINPAILLHGPSGTAKTMIIDKIKALGWGKTYEITSETKSSELRTMFKEAKLPANQPSIILIDELESLVTKENSRSMTTGIEKQIAAELKTAADNRIMCIAATSQLNEIPKRLVEYGGFDTQISLRVPAAASRKQIIRSLTDESYLSNDLVDTIADRTPAFVGRDLASLVTRAGRFFEERARNLKLKMSDDNYRILEEDVEKALHIVRPSAMRDAVLEPPKVKWDDIGGQEEVKKILRTVCERQDPDLQSRLGRTPQKGLLLYGPPGCSKTLSAQAMATEASLNFFAVKGAELLNMYVGESERQVREVFQKARAASPSIIFFDEIESIGSKRDGSKSNSGVNVLTTLLNEMDGIETLKDVTVLAATNQPEALDLALLRPGRFDKFLYVAPPDFTGRQSILRIQSQKRELDGSVDIPELAALTEGYSGAEMVAICNEATEIVYQECKSKGNGFFRAIGMDDFREGIRRTMRQITPDVVRKYEQWAGRMGVGVDVDKVESVIKLDEGDREGGEDVEGMGMLDEAREVLRSVGEGMRGWPEEELTRFVQEMKKFLAVG